MILLFEFWFLFVVFIVNIFMLVGVFLFIEVLYVFVVNIGLLLFKFKIVMFIK